MAAVRSAASAMPGLRLMLRLRSHSALSGTASMMLSGRTSHFLESADREAGKTPVPAVVVCVVSSRSGGLILAVPQRAQKLQRVPRNIHLGHDPPNIRYHALQRVVSEFLEFLDSKIPD